MSGHYDDELEAPSGAGAPCRSCPNCFADAPQRPSDAQGCERKAQDLSARIQIGPTDV